MFIPERLQLLALLESVLVGAGLGLIYDVLRALRRKTHAGAARTALCDAVFWLVVLAALFVFQIAFAPGQSRYYLLAGVVGGGVVYFTLPGPLCLACLEAMLDGVLTLLGTVKRLWRMAKRRRNAEKTDIPKKNFAKNSSLFRKKGIK